MKNGVKSPGVRRNFMREAPLLFAGAAMFGVGLAAAAIGTPAIRAQSSPIQSAEVSKPRFEVASVKPCPADAVPTFVRGGSRNTAG
jgi:hypothetical protein